MTASRAARRWLFKSEPETFSLADLARAKKPVPWDGVRNYQARNFLRDDAAPGDLVLFYHSSAEPPGVAGVAEIVRAGYPDPTQFRKGHDGFDPGSQPDAPRWIAVDLKHRATFPTFVTRDALAADPSAKTMDVLRRGNRLSIQPVTPAQFDAVLRLGGAG
ncbi:MAG TPA: EVE domain-containing protein [Planctomycetota bacterium]|nr:EVE domain-containing protein [Planctomycetota bacterium]